MRTVRLPLAFSGTGIALLVSAVIGARLIAQATPGTVAANRICVLCDLGAKEQDPARPQFMGLMADGGDGYIYGTSSSGGRAALQANQGTIFRFSKKTGALETLFSFGYQGGDQVQQIDHGLNPMSGLVRAPNQPVFYGTTYQGGHVQFLVKAAGQDVVAAHSGVGVLYRYRIGAAEPEVLHTFRNGDYAGYKQTCTPPPVRCYYTTQQRLNAAASYPMSAPVLASDGNYYGVASVGDSLGTGILYRFTPPDPSTGVAGDNMVNGPESFITALCVGGPMPASSPDLQEADLRKLCMFNGTMGLNPLSLTSDSKYPGVLFGTTIGATPEAPYGTVFQASLEGRVKTIKNFKDPTEGSHPFGVMVGSDGFLYGATRDGGYVGMGNPAAGGGVVYRISPAGPAGFASGAGFEVLHKLNAVGDGSASQAQLVEVKTPVIDPVTRLPGMEKTFLYGTAAATGEGLRGVIFRVDAAQTKDSYEVVYTFPNDWSASGSFPSSTMITATDPNTNKPVVYGTTNVGGLGGGGTVFRLGGLDLPRVYPTMNTTLFYPRTNTKRVSQTFTVPGQTLPVTVTVQTDIDGIQLNKDGVRTDGNQGIDGIRIDAAYCRNPHIIQFISRDKEVLSRLTHTGTGTFIAGDYHTASGVTYPFSTEAHTYWHVDAVQGPPNPFYDENLGSLHLVTANSITILDQPTFGTASVGLDANNNFLVNYVDKSPEQWRALFRDYVICNCKVVAVVRWAREAGFHFDADPSKETHTAWFYSSVSMTPGTDDDLKWVNDQLMLVNESGKTYALLP